MGKGKRCSQCDQLGQKPFLPEKAHLTSEEEEGEKEVEEEAYLTSEFPFHDFDACPSSLPSPLSPEDLLSKKLSYTLECLEY